MRSENAVLVEDASGFRGHADSFFAPGSEAELIELLRTANRDGTPVTAVGSRTGVAGGCVPSEGWAISLERLQRLEIRNGSGVAASGVALKTVQAAAAPSRQFYAPDPTEHTASVGGSIATNASGSRSFLYGDTRRHVLGMRVVLMDGTVLDLKRGEPVPFDLPDIPLPATTKFSAGFPLHAGIDYLDLFIGSEGTIGIVTEATLRLLSIPGELLSGVVFFPSDATALNAVELWRSVGGLRMLEYMDAGSLDLLRSRFSEIPANAQAALLIEQEIPEGDAVDEWVDRLEITGAFIEKSWFGDSAADRERFRVFRHALPEVVNETVRRRGLTKMGTDFAVPLARNAEMMQVYRTMLDREFPGRYVIFGHIGDAHVHVNILPHDEEESVRARALITELARSAVAMGGTVAAEHGLGKRKAHLLAIQWPEETIRAMAAVKRRLDPQWLLGRGNLFPSTISPDS